MDADALKTVAELGPYWALVGALGVAVVALWRRLSDQDKRRHEEQKTLLATLDSIRSVMVVIQDRLGR